MRTVQTFVLRLIVNADDPLTLRGVVRSVATGEEHRFSSHQELLQLLREITLAAEEPPEVVPDGAEAH